MKRIGLVFVVLGALASAPRAYLADSTPVGSFRLLATFNVPGGTAAEIISTTPDGRYVVYSDAIGRRFGLVDITNPAAPVEVDELEVDGDPTSIAVLPQGGYAVGCVQPGRLLLIDLSDLTIAAERAIGPGPDSIAVTTVAGKPIAVIAIENEGALGPGFVEIVQIDLADFPNSPGTVVGFPDATLAQAGLLATSDPQPEFVSIRGTRAAVTLQENNGVAIVDISNPLAPVLERIFSTGVVDDRPADLLDDSRVAFTQSYPGNVIGAGPATGARIPDAIGWSADGLTLFTADEGEESFEGGRGWSAHHATGGLYYDDEGSLERAAVRVGHYPDGRSDAKGIETEGLATAQFGEREFLFVTSERGSFLAVYRLDPQNRAHLVQLLGTGQGPESVLPIPDRDLVLTANEGDDGDGSISIFAGVPGNGPVNQDRPQISSASVATPWGALSGLAGDVGNPQLLYSVPDDALPSAIYRIRTGGPGAAIDVLAPVTKDGEQMLYDLEGIAVDTSIARPAAAGFWLACEGNATSTRNALVQVDSEGRVLREIPLPADVDAPGGRITSNGFEGVTVSSDGRYLVVAVQRPYSGDVTVTVPHTRVARYDLLLNRWEAFFYPLTVAPGTIGLSEITLVGQTATGDDVYAVIERDNRLAGRATIKRIYTFTLMGLVPVDIATLAGRGTVTGARIAKTLFRDILTENTPYEKVEGLGLTPRGDLWVVLDNDGGEFESRLVRFPGAFVR